MACITLCVITSQSLFCIGVSVCLCLWLKFGVYLAADSQCRGGGDRFGTEPRTGGQRDGTVEQEWNHCRQQTHGHRPTHTHSYPHSVKAQKHIYSKHLIQILLMYRSDMPDTFLLAKSYRWMSKEILL